MPAAFYKLLADGIVLVHLGYVLAVVLGLLAIIVGLLAGWGWARHFWLRVTHLGMIAFVVVEAWLGVTCPLTVWEHRLRVAAGENPDQRSFIGGLAHDLLFYEGPPWVFTLAYSLFGAAVLATFILGPPRRKPRGGNAKLESEKAGKVQVRKEA